MEFKTETRSKEQHRETAVTDVVAVIQEVHAQNTFCIYWTCRFSSSVPAKLFNFLSCGALSHQASMSIILQSDEGHRQRGLLIITAREVKYKGPVQKPGACFQNRRVGCFCIIPTLKQFSSFLSFTPGSICLGVLFLLIYRFYVYRVNTQKYLGVPQKVSVCFSRL